MGDETKSATLAGRAFFELNAQDLVSWDTAASLAEMTTGNDFYVTFTLNRDVYVYLSGTSRLWRRAATSPSLELAQIRTYGFDTLQPEALSNDGRLVVGRTNGGGVGAADALTQKIIWNDQKPFPFEKEAIGEAETQVIDPAPANGRDLVLATSLGHYYRWDLATGKRLKMLSLPERWRIWMLDNFTMAGVNYLRTLVRMPDETMVNQLIEYPSGKPKLSWPSAPESESSLFDNSTAKLLQYRSDYERFLALREKRDVPPLAPPSGFVERSSTIRDLHTSLSGELRVVLWSGRREVDLPTKQQGMLPMHSTLTLMRRSDVGSWTSPPVTTEPASLDDLTHVRISPDDTMIAAWGKSGAAVWDATTGRTMRTMRARSKRILDACIDSAGNHLVLYASDSAVMVDLNIGTVRNLHVERLAKVGCTKSGLIGTEPANWGRSRLFHWNWDGQFDGEPIDVDNAHAPDLELLKSKNRSLSNQSGRSLSRIFEACTDDVCRPLIGTLAKAYSRSALDAAYVLDGSLLVAVTPYSARFLSPDGQRILGIIGHVGENGWYFSNVSSIDELDFSERSRLTPSGLRGHSNIELFPGVNEEDMSCSSNETFYPWALCKDWYEEPGAFQRMLNQRSTMPDR